MSRHNSFRKSLVSNKIDSKQKTEFPWKNLEWHCNQVKSKTAESIVEQLFLFEEYKVHKYGMESVLPQILGSIRNDESETARQIRSMPDFIIQTPELDNVYFVEVKFRANGQYSFQELEKEFEYPYKNTYFILVSRSAIKCLTYRQLKLGWNFNNGPNNHLCDRVEFRFSAENYNMMISMLSTIYCDMD